MTAKEHKPLGNLQSTIALFEAEVRKDEQIGYPPDEPSLLLQEARKALDQSVAALISEARAEATSDGFDAGYAAGQKEGRLLGPVR